MTTIVRITRVKQIRGGEAGLATREASLTLASLGRVPWEEGIGHAWLLAYVGTMGPRLGLALGALVHSSLSPASQVLRGY